MGMHNMEASVESFARSCFNYALDTKQDLWFGAKDTISKTYDGKFKEIFQRIYEEEFQEKFDAAGLTYFYSLIDDIVARVMKAEGGFIWACKNYDGDVMSDMVSSAFGSLAMMTSVLVSPKATMSTKLLTEQSRDITTAIWKERKLPPTLWQRFSHGQALSGNAASWTETRLFPILPINWKRRRSPLSSQEK